jgi:hypothetical protein
MSPEDIVATYKQYGIDGTVGTPPAAESGVVQAAPPASTGAQNPSRSPKADSAVVWRLRPDKSMEPVKVSLGITDHAYTEVLAVIKGDLKPGDEVIIRSVLPKGQTLAGIRR